MSLFSLHDAFEVVVGQAPVAVGAPHHGTRPNADADQGTAPIALALASELGADAVVTHDLRRIVDVNKNPLHLNATVRGYALRYQNALFRTGPRLVIEIHGHTSGRYEVEISPGFDLDPTLPGDALFLEKLAALRQALPGILAARIGHRPSVGVYPLERDVEKAATATFTFQKIRRARALAGLEWYGLHIELSRDLRMGREARSAPFIGALASGLATGIRVAFEPWPSAVATIPTPNGASRGETVLLGSQVLRMAKAPANRERDTVVFVHPADLETLGALDGDTVIVRHGDEELRCVITPSRTVAPGRAGMPSRLRHQIGLARRGKLTVGRPAPLGSAGASWTESSGFTVVHEVRPSRDRQIWLAPDEIERLSLSEGVRLHVQGQPSLPSVNSTVWRTDPSLPPRSAATSQGLLDRLVLTLGEVISLRIAT